MFPAEADCWPSIQKRMPCVGWFISQLSAALEFYEFPRFNVYDLSAGIMFMNLVGKPIFGWGTAMSQHNYFGWIPGLRALRAPFGRHELLSQNIPVASTSHFLGLFTEKEGRILNGSL